MRSLFSLAAIAVAAIATAQIPTETEALKRPGFTTGGDVLIRNGTVLTITRGTLPHTDVLIRGGKITAIAPNLTAPAGVRVIDATGKFVTPGIVDAHSHRAMDSVNEGANSITSETRILDVLNVNDPGLYYALASGITTSMLLHGSANPIGGQSIVVKSKWMARPQDAIVQTAPKFIKFALGENPKGDPSSDNPRFPATRQGVEAIIRRAFADAKDYIRRWDDYALHASDLKLAPPRRDLRLEAIADILRGRTWVQCHSYRQDEILMIAKLSKELGFHLVIQHGLETYKIAPELAKMGIPASVFGGGFAYKLEVIDSAPICATILDNAGVLTSVNTDTSSGNVPLTQDAGRTLRYGLSPDRALRLVTINPAKQLGVDNRLGSIEVGKDGDIAIWTGHPLSVYSKCAFTLIEGEVMFERRDQFKVDALSMAAESLVTNLHDIASNVTPKSANAYLIKNATLHTISDGTLPNAALLIVDGKVARVGGAGVKLDAPAGATVIDAKGMHVYPGMFDAGANPGLDEIGQIPQALDSRENGDLKPDLRAINSTNPESLHLPKAFTHGVLNLLDIPTGGTIPGQAAVIHTFGSTTSDLAVEALGGLLVAIPAGVDGRLRNFLTPDEIERRNAQVGERIKRLEQTFETAQRYFEAKAANQGWETDVKIEALKPYLEGEKPVFLLVGSTSSIRNAIALAKKFKFKAVLMGANEAWKMPKAIKDSGYPVILTPPQIECPEEDVPTDPLDPYDSPFAAAGILYRNGVKFAFATNTFDGSFNIANRVGRCCAYGLPWDAAMKALTLDAAEILGVGDRLGSIAPGKLANIVISDGDPLDLSSQVRFVFVKGQPVPIRSHYTELWQKYSVRR